MSINNIPTDLLATQDAPETGGSIKIDSQPKTVSVTTPEIKEEPLAPAFIPEPSKTYTAKSSVNIDDPAKSGVRPNITGNSSHDTTAGRIRRPSAGLAEKLAESGKRMREEQAALDADASRAAIEQSPEAVGARLAFLERSLKRVQGELSKLKKGEKS